MTRTKPKNAKSKQTKTQIIHTKNAKMDPQKSIPPKPTMPILCFGQLLIAPGPAWSVLDRSSDTNLPSPSRHQLRRASWLGVQPCVLFPSQLWVLIWLGPVQLLCILSQPLRVHVCLGPVMSERHCFLRVIRHLWLLESVHSLFYAAPWAAGKAGLWWRHSV